MMPLGSNIATRITGLLLIGFVAVQLVVLAMMALPARGTGVRPYNLPAPEEMAAMIGAIETAPAARRPALVALLNGSLFTVRLQPGDLPGEGDAGAADLRAIRADYAAALPGRRIAVAGRPGVLGRLLRGRSGPMHYFSPVRITVTLADGEALTVDGRPSALVRDYLRQRALMGAAGGLIVLGALAFAVRQTTRPLTRMSAGVRRFATGLDAPDLPIEGSREVRDLSLAFNEMKARIGGLVAERTRVLAAVAHDLRTYLTRLRLRAEFIEDADQRARAVADLAEMALLIDDTLLFARTDAGVEAQPLLLDLSAEIDRLVAERVEMGEAVTRAGIADRVMLSVDPLALRRMLANLIDNGLRYGTGIRVALAVTGDAAEVSVLDDGPGVPAEALARLGQPYTRLDPSRDRASGGAGLGLAIVHALAAQSGARLTLANRTPHGLAATLRFPIAG